MSFSFAMGMVSRKVCIRVLPKQQRPGGTSSGCRTRRGGAHGTEDREVLIHSESISGAPTGEVVVATSGAVQEASVHKEASQRIVG